MYDRDQKRLYLLKRGEIPQKGLTDMAKNKFQEIISRVQWAEDLGEGARQREILGGALKRLASLVMERHYMAGHSDQDAARHMIEAAREAADEYLTTNVES